MENVLLLFYYLWEIILYIILSFQVESFPSLYLYRNGKKISEYDGSRSLDDLYEFVMGQTGAAHDEL